MKKILIPILAFSLYSCTTTKQVEEYGCDLSEHNVGYHIHSGTYIENGKTKVWVSKVDNNDQCKHCRED